MASFRIVRRGKLGLWVYSIPLKGFIILSQWDGEVFDNLIDAIKKNASLGGDVQEKGQEGRWYSVGHRFASDGR